jgi:hypothetical protein
MEASTATTPRKFEKVDGWKRGRFYDVDGKHYPSVTTILGCIGKPALMNWYAKTEREMVLKVAGELWEDLPVVEPKMSRQGFMNSLTDRLGKAKAGEKALKQASDIGSECHGLIEWSIKKELGLIVGEEPRVSQEATWAFMAYEDWRKGVNLAPHWIEQTVYSRRYEYAGMADWAGEIDGPDGRIHVIGDWKTGKAIYAEALLQNAAYVHAACEMGQTTGFVNGIIVRLPKNPDDPSFETRLVPTEQQKELFKVFLHVLELWTWLDKQ